MADEGEYMRSKDFVINNIEHLQPSTLRKIFRRKGTEPAGAPTSLVREPPEKYTRMNEYDAMVILKWLIGGCSPERIRDHYPCYSVRQINKVRSDFARLRTEKVPTNTTALMSSLKRGTWF